MVDNRNTYTFKKFIKNKKIIRLGVLVVLVIFLIATCFLLIFPFSVHTKYPFITMVIVLASLIVLSREMSTADKEFTDMRKHNYFTWGKGAGAELIVMRNLEELGDEYKIINDFQTGRGNIDHICVGPTGIFVIETKAHKGSISYDGGKLKRNKQDLEKYFLKQTKAGCFFIDQLIKEKLGKDYYIVSILIFANAVIDRQTINRPIEGVWVGGRKFENWVIKQNKSNLNSEEISKIYELLLNEGQERKNENV